MTTTKPTRQQVVEALHTLPQMTGLIQGRVGLQTKLNASIDDIADALVRAGIAEEPREEGYYWCKAYSDKEEWMILFWNGAEWCDWKGGTWPGTDGHPVAIHQQRILPPQD